MEIVKKITSGHAARTLKKRVQPAQRSKDSIDNNSQIVKGVTWAQALEGVVDNSGAYLPNVKEKGSDIWGTLQLRPLHNQNLTNRILTKEALKESSHLYLRGVPYKTSNNRILTKEDIVKEHALKTYNQNPSDPRGMVEIDEQAHEAIIRVFEQADPSTIVHELAHIYLTMLQNAAKLRHTTKT